MRHRRLQQLVAAYSILIMTSTATHADEARTWTSADGKFKVEAELVEVTADSIRLRKTDGSEVNVPLAKISAADLAYVKQAAAQRFVIPGLVSVATPKDGFAWKAVKQMEQDNVKAFVLLCSKEGSDARIVLIVEGRKAADDGQKIATIKAHYNGLVDTLQQSGIKIEKAVQPGLNTPVPKSVSYSVSGTLPGGGRTDVRGATVFGECIYAFQIIAGNKVEADQLAKVVDSLQEVSAAKTASPKE